jgi:hypothetical protein
MPGYPASWTETWAAFDPKSNGSPYTAEEIEDYLVGCRSSFSPLKPPFVVRSIRFVMSRSLTSARFWLWEVLEEDDTEWFVVVGSGKSPFYRETRNLDRWLHAETNDERLTAEEYLEREIADYSSSKL